MRIARLHAGLCVLTLTSVVATAGDVAPAPSLTQVRSGYEFQSAETRALQDDPLQNPGMLWVEQGAQLWAQPAGASGQSCASCHGEAATSMRGVATRYPLVDPQTGKLLNLELRIQQCRAERQHGPALEHESEDLLALTTFVAHQSRGMPKQVSIDGPARPFFEAGRLLYVTRQGQLNLACSQCHDENWGKDLAGNQVPQGHPTGYPLYRLEWQSLGSLRRRLRNCLVGMRAEAYPYGAPEYVDLELYLMSRAAGMPIETPAVRP
jgi:sulfur-oxidizing protein SoxA